MATVTSIDFLTRNKEVPIAKDKAHTQHGQILEEICPA
jgi:hypothetical protein